MPRKAIAMHSVVVNTNEPDAPGGSYWEIRSFALCDDGSMWRLGEDDRYQDAWIRLPDMPQVP